MKKKFKIGDKVQINPIYKNEIADEWYNAWEGEIMTVKGNKYDYGIHISVKENSGMWSYKHLIPYEDFFKEEEFII